MFKTLSYQQIHHLLLQAGLKSQNIQKIAVGFSNDVYDIDGRYILKAGKSETDWQSLNKEHYFCQLFKDKLPTAPIIFADFTGQLTERPYIIYKKVSGDNLYIRWHLYSKAQRRELVRHITTYLKLINETDPKDYIKRFEINAESTWQEAILEQIDTHLQYAVSQSLISEELQERIGAFVEAKQDVLTPQKMVLTYFDPHFDNFIVKDGQIQAMLDFERVDYLSIDYVLDLVKRMVEHPTKYASEEAEQYIEPEDYQELLEWYEEFYPELFEFPQLEDRLDLYAVRYNLKILGMFPDDQRLAEELTAIVSL